MKMSTVNPTEFPEYNIERIKDTVIKAVLINTVASSANKKTIAAAKAGYRKKFGHAMLEGDDVDLKSLMIFGPPGQGKTSIVKQACKEAASLMGLDFIDSKKLAVTGQIPGANHFVLAIKSLSGALSPTTLIGLPTKVSPSGTDDYSYTGNIPDKQLADVMYAVKQGGAGVFFLDDFANASTQMMTTIYNIAEEGEFNGQPFPYTIFASNFGKKDGNKSTELPSALLNRMEACVYNARAEDVIRYFRGVEDYVIENNKESADGIRTIADAYISALAAVGEPLISWNGAPAKDGAFSTPRSLESLLIKTIIDGHATYAEGLASGGRKSFQAMCAGLTKKTQGNPTTQKFISSFMRSASALCGQNASTLLSAYIEDYLDSVLPLVQTVFEDVPGSKSEKDQLDTYSSAVSAAYAGGRSVDAISLGFKMSDIAASLAGKNTPKDLNREDTLVKVEDSIYRMMLCVKDLDSLRGAACIRSYIELHLVKAPSLIDPDFTKKPTVDMCVYKAISDGMKRAKVADAFYGGIKSHLSGSKADGSEVDADGLRGSVFDQK
jgi:hypothetical protein